MSTKRYRVVPRMDWPTDQPAFGIDFVLADGALRVEAGDIVAVSSSDPSGHSVGICGAKCVTCARDDSTKAESSKGWLVDQGFVVEVV